MITSLHTDVQEMPLLTTKLYIPPLRPGLVSRPRLVAFLNKGIRAGCKLTLISAPAGFGKTTLLSEWAQAAPMRVAWVLLDEGDNDPARFWRYVIAALEIVQAGVGENALAMLRAPGLRSPSPEPALAVLINEIAALPDRVSLVLDDYHLIAAGPVHDALTFFLDHLPDNLHLVIATRADPPLPIARLRGRGQLIELRQAHLCFTRDEAAAFLSQLIHVPLSAGEIATLTSRTEGWAAGLQMAAASLQGRDMAHVSAFIHAFTGSDRYILDYLVEEVFQRQPGHIQDFLLYTSILRRLAAPLCDAVIESVPADLRTDREIKAHPAVDSRAILGHLERANLFIVPLDDRREWYRYHHLFADLLRSRLHAAQPDLVPSLHRRAGEWYERGADASGDEGLAAEAIEHALAAGDVERSARLIEREAEAVLMRSEIATFLRWIEALPDKKVQARPHLCLFHAWALLLGGYPVKEVEARLDQAGQGGDEIAGRLTPLHAFVAIFQGELSRAAALSRQALERLPEDDLFLRGLAAWNLGAAYLVDGNVQAAEQVLDEAIRIGQETGHAMIAVLALSHLAQQCMVTGQTQQAAALFRRALALATDEYGNRLPIASEALVGLGRLSREWNDLDAAVQYLEEGIALTTAHGEIWAMEGYLALARIRQVLGDTDGARTAMDRARQLALQFDAIESDDLVVALYQTRILIAQGRLGDAERALREWDVSVETIAAGTEKAEVYVDTYLRGYKRLVQARLDIAQNHPGEAIALLDEALPWAQEYGWIRIVIEVEVLRALALWAQGNVARAVDALGHALSLGEPGGYVRMFLDEGEPVARLLREAVSRGIAADYARRLLAALGKERSAQDVPSPQSLLVEPLSERELDVLQLIAEGLTNREIAGRVFLSINTIKSHNRNIFEKLGVRNRMQAVAKARELGILPPA
jgi:LuxR family maltose regulon positive regulatory protein